MSPSAKPDRNLALELVRVTEAAAMAGASFPKDEADPRQTYALAVGE